MRPMRSLIAALAALALGLAPAAAQSVLRDAETEAFFRDIAEPLARAAKLDPRSLSIGLIGDPQINAFATQGQAVYFHSGLLLAADDVGQVQGVLAHELGHIAKGDTVLFEDSLKGAQRISILSLLLGVAAIAAGAGDAGAGILAAGQQAAQGKYLAFSREQESETDIAGAAYLEAAGLSGRGSLEFLRKIQNQEFRLGIPQSSDNAYARTHPLSGERIQTLDAIYRASPHWLAPLDPALEARFQRIKAKLAGYVEPPERTLQLYPESDTRVPARYARVYAFHKSAFIDKALAEIDALLADAPQDPWFLEIKGQVLLESGRVEEALPPLRRAWALTREPLVAATLGHALIATERPAEIEEARIVLRTAVARDNQNPFAWYQLGIAYDRAGDMPRAALATAERHNLGGTPQLALLSARTALAGLPTGSADWLRAQDIMLVSQSQLEERKRRGRRR